MNNVCLTCPTRLAHDNRGKFCSRCDKERVDAEVLGDSRASIARAARRAAVVFVSPGCYRSKAEYLNALTDELDAICRVTGIEPPEFVR